MSTRRANFMTKSIVGVVAPFSLPAVRRRRSANALTALTDGPPTLRRVRFGPWGGALSISMATDDLWALAERLKNENAELSAERRALLERISALERQLEEARAAGARWAEMLAKQALNPAGQTSTFGPAEARALAAYLRDVKR